MPGRRALVIVGKAPRAGQSKTRLVPPLSPSDAAELSGAFLRDTAELGLALGWECVTVVHPAAGGERELLARLLPAGVRCIAQTGTGLGDALRGAFARHFSEGFRQVVLVNSDSPTLPRRLLDEACAALAKYDVVLGPSADGGYYLLGLRDPRPGLFDNIAWSTPRVLEQTLARAAGSTVALVDEWFDVDEPADLVRLQADLRAQPADVAPHTRKVLEGLATLIARGVRPSESRTQDESRPSSVSEEVLGGR
jgi:rSAM/selenodomain-associated transferase 1